MNQAKLEPTGFFSGNPKKWYNNWIFPLVPIINFRSADKHHTSKISFKWLFLTFWTLDGFSFELSIIANTHWGIGVIGLLPYLRFAITIPCLENISRWVMNNLHRDRNKKQ